MHKVIVEPLANGWAVKADKLANDMVFASGRAAEKAGRDLALKLAEAGEQTELELWLKGGRRAARFVCLPPLPQEDAPLMIGGPLLRGGPSRARQADPV